MQRTTVKMLGAFAAVLAAGTATAAGTLTVRFVAPAQFTDAGYATPMPGEKERAEVMRDLEGHLRQLAARGLRDDEILRVEILDIDLAGSFEPWLGPSAGNLRVVRDVTGPRLRLRYVLERGRSVLASREEQLSDPAFLMAPNRYAGSDRLRYEKALLDQWFEQRIVRRPTEPAPA